MPIYYALGNALVSEEELSEKQALGSITDFTKAVAHDPAEAVLEFSSGVLTRDNLNESLTLPTGEVTPFKEIGPGKPLAVEIRHVYTGKYPKKTFFDSSKGMLVTSAIKSIASFNASPRAVNFVKKDIEAYHHTSNPAATEEGTPLLWYSPALTERNSVLTLEIGFDEFPNELFDALGGALTQAAGIPLFTSASSYLLMAGVISKLAGTIGSKIFDHDPVFRATESLIFTRPGELPPQADFRIVVNEDVDSSFLKNYQLSAKGLVDSAGNRYEGDIPYIIISLDGHKYEEYNEFAPTAASAVLLEKFFKIREGQNEPLGPLVDALKLYNDWNFRKKADKITLDLTVLDEESSEYKTMKDRRDAFVANILNDALKP